MLPLPIDAHLPGLVAQLRDQSKLVLVAEPGAGKTTRLPRALLDAGLSADGEILVLEPRRLAARMAARRVADELGESVGRTIGYQVRFEDRSSAETRVRFVTEGVLTRKLIHDPTLRGVGTVLLDEFHERHLQGDLALALLRRLQRQSRPELRLCAMSATLEATELAAFLGCETVCVPGRRFEVAIEYADRPDTRRLEQQVASAVRRLLRDGLDGHVLVFLPGAGEIRRTRETLEPIAREAGLRLAVLHGDLSADEQDRALEASPERKLILATNVAESSLTIEGVSTVIDSGLSRVAGYSAWSGLPTLETQPISRASATQRAGRAGRLRSGRCLRLYTRHDHDARPPHDKPEIARADLCETSLGLHAIGAELSAEQWLQAPPAEAWSAAEELNRWLGAVDAAGRLTELGQRMLRFPLHPRLCRVLLHADELGERERGCTLAALLSERDIWLEARARLDARSHARDVQIGPSDAVDRLERFDRALAADFGASELRALELDAGAVRAVARTRQRLLQLQRGSRPGVHRPREVRSDDAALLQSILAGFGDRVGKRRAPGSAEIVLARGGSTSQAPLSVAREGQWLVVLDASQRGSRQVIAHMLSEIEPEWLLELFPDRVEDRTEVRFDPQRERVEATHTLRYGALLLDEGRADDPSGPEAERVLYEAALARGLQSWDTGDGSRLERFAQRAAFAASVDREIPALPEHARALALRSACAGKRSFAELRAEDQLVFLAALLPASAVDRIDRIAPEQVTLPSGRRLEVHYEAGRPPWVSSRLQDFFGSERGPRLGDRDLVLHLLAPNQRAVQVTTDLAGFWQRHYPELRRQLMRRYPRHDWPEDPLHAAPPQRRDRQR
jgi:ATP-dependent helicase HrpB